MPKVFIVNGSDQYRQMFIDKGWELTYNLDEADLFQFTGGEDVSPELYGEAVHPRTYFNSRRDLVEAGYYAWGVRTGKKMAGICRGGQFLNVMNDGSMYQDVDGHAIHGTHQIVDIISGKTCQVTSTHHQMMYPAHDGELVAYANQCHRAEWMEPGYDKPAYCPDMQDFKDAEVIFYEQTNSLCFQPHPEFPHAISTRDYYFELLERYLGLSV